MKDTIRKSAQRILAFSLALAVVFGLLSTTQLTTYGYTAQTGMIYSSDKSTVETFTTASTSGNHARYFLYGKPVTVINETTGSDGELWYQISYTLKSSGSTETSYVKASNVLLDKNATVFASGTINASSVSLRNDAGTSGTTILATLNTGHSLELLDSTTVDSALWYRVRTTANGTTYIGWVYGTYVTVQQANIQTDANYEAYLRSLGFPESYVSKLAVLHAQYPNWVFEPYFTGLDWSTAVAAESTPGRNLVYKTENDAKKSTDSRAYNWSTNTWTVYDSSGWVSAHPDFIAYCMDPRNFLNATNIFMFESLSYSSAHTSSGVKAVLKNSFLADTSVMDYVTTFMEVAKESGVSAYHIASRVRQEQSATSPMISGTYSGYEGYYNYFNIGASGVGDKVYTSGLSYAKSQGWDTRYKSILGGANFIKKSYIGVGQDTLYTQKFDVVSTGGLYTHQYMTNVQAAISESKTIANAMDKTQTYVFKIPVYNNMPSEPVSFTASGNRNNYLSSLSVSGVSLTPTFTGSTNSYSIIVDEAVSSITVSATAVASTSTVSGTGTYNLGIGTNTIKVYCKSQSGSTNTYTLTVVRQGTSNANYTLSSSAYTIGTYITGVEPGTSASSFIGNISCTGGTVKLLTASGTENTGTVTTGSKLAVYVDGVLVATKDVVVYGDVSGDGKINVLDGMIVNKYTIGLHSLKGSYYSAADVNHDGKMNVLDAMIVNRYTIGLSTISQK